MKYQGFLKVKFELKNVVKELTEFSNTKGELPLQCVCEILNIGF